MFNARIIAIVLSHEHLAGAWIASFERFANSYELASYFNDKCQKATNYCCYDQAYYPSYNKPNNSVEKCSADNSPTCDENYCK